MIYEKLTEKERVELKNNKNYFSKILYETKMSNKAVNMYAGDKNKSK